MYKGKPSRARFPYFCHLSSTGWKMFASRKANKERHSPLLLPRYAAQYKLSGISSIEVLPSCGTTKAKERGTSRLSSTKDSRMGVWLGDSGFLVVTVTRKELKAKHTSSNDAFGASETKVNFQLV